MSKRYRIFGAGGHGRVIAACIRSLTDDRNVQFIDDREGPPSIGGIVRLTTDVLQDAGSDIYHYLIGMGDNGIRKAIADRLNGLNFQYGTATHPTAVVDESARIGKGSVILAGAIIGPGAVVGSHCIINHGSLLDHDCVMKDFSSLGPHATVGGNCKIGAGAVVAIGATVVHGIQIGSNTILGAGAVAVKNAEPNAVYLGIPARKMRDRLAGEPYL